jgi:hypothetical protein
VAPDQVETEDEVAATIVIAGSGVVRPVLAAGPAPGGPLLAVRVTWRARRASGAHEQHSQDGPVFDLIPSEWDAYGDLAAAAENTLVSSGPR